VGPVPRVIEIGQDTEVARVKGEDFLMFGFTIGVVTLVLAVNRVTLAIESIYAYGGRSQHRALCGKAIPAHKEGLQVIVERMVLLHDDDDVFDLA